MLFSMVDVPIYVPTNTVEVLLFSTLCSIYSCRFLLIMVILTSMRWCFIVFWICVSILISDVETFPRVFLAICGSSFEKCLFRSAQFLIGLFVIIFFILNCRSCLYILEINPVSFALFANIFSYSEGDLFIYFLVSFGVQKFPSLIGSHSFILIFIFITLGGELRAILLWFTSKSVLTMFSSMSFIVSGLSFKSLVHFISNFILLHIAVQFSQHHLLKRLSFLHCLFFPHLSKITCL